MTGAWLAALAVSGYPTSEDQGDSRGLVQACVGRAGCPTLPGWRTGPWHERERFLRLLDAAEYLAAHIHEAPVWIVPCFEGGSPTRT
jgi:hypothetical protein